MARYDFGNLGPKKSKAVKVWQHWLPNDEGVSYEGPSEAQARLQLQKYGGGVKQTTKATDLEPIPVEDAGGTWKNDYVGGWVYSMENWNVASAWPDKGKSGWFGMGDGGTRKKFKTEQEAKRYAESVAPANLVRIHRERPGTKDTKATDLEPVPVEDAISYGEHNPTGKCRECGGPNYGKYAVCQACMRKSVKDSSKRDRLHRALDAVMDSRGAAKDADKPTAEQMTALKKWASEHGRTWRTDLNHAWMTGDYDGFEQSNLLQQLRNSFGPTWLSRVKIFA